MSSVWKGLAQISGPRAHPILDGNAGAFVWLGAQADSEEIFRRRVHAAMQAEGLIVVELDQVAEIVDPDDENEALAYIYDAALNDPTLVAHDSFHRFKNHDA
jgi:hypothetical protein